MAWLALLGEALQAILRVVAAFKSVTARRHGRNANDLQRARLREDRTHKAAAARRFERLARVDDDSLREPDQYSRN